MNQIDRNKEEHKVFDHPIWDNSLVYAMKAPEHAERMTNWDEIRAKLELTKPELNLVQKLWETASPDGKVTFTSRKQKMTALKGNDFVREIGGDYYLNPAIVWARNWWSPCCQGIMAVRWMNQLTCDLVVSECIGDFRTGATHASNDQKIAQFLDN